MNEHDDPIAAAHQRLAARAPRYARVARLEEWPFPDGHTERFVCFEGKLSVKQIEWAMAALSAEMRRGAGS